MVVVLGVWLLIVAVWCSFSVVEPPSPTTTTTTTICDSVSCMLSQGDRVKDTPCVSLLSVVCCRSPWEDVVTRNTA